MPRFTSSLKMGSNHHIILSLLNPNEFCISFKLETEGFGTENVEGRRGNEDITSEKAFQMDLKHVEALMAQVKSNYNIGIRLRSALVKVLGNRFEHNSISIPWSMAFLSATTAVVNLEVGGDFFEGFLREYKDPVKIKVVLQIFVENKPVVSITSKEMSPSVYLRRDARGKQYTCAFEDELRVEVKERIQTNKTYRGKLSIQMLLTGNMVLEDLPCKFTMGKDILENKTECDFEIVAENESRFDCHKVFLAANSKPLAEMIKAGYQEPNAIKLQLSPEAVTALLKFIYYSNVEDPMNNPTIAFELLRIGHQYEILGLERGMRNIFLGKQVEWFDIDTSVLLYLWTLKVDENEDLKWKALQSFKSKPDDLEDSTEYDKLMKEFPQTAKGLIALCFKI